MGQQNGNYVGILDRDVPSTMHSATIAFSPDGKRLAVASQTNELPVWELPDLRATGEGGPRRIANPDLTFRPSGAYREISTLAFSPDGQELRCLAGRSIEMFDVTAREDAGLGPEAVERLSFSAISPDGTRIVLCDVNNGVAIVWDLLTNREVFRTPASPSVTTRPAFSSDGRRIALVRMGTTSGESPAILIYDTHTGELLSTLTVKPRDSSTSSYFASPVFRPDGRQVAALVRSVSQSENQFETRIVVWDAATTKELFFAVTDASTTAGVKYSRDGASLIVVVRDRSVAGAVLFDASTGEEQKSVPISGFPNHYVIDGHNQMIGAAVSSDFVLWDLTTGQERLRIPGYADLATYAISPDGSRIVLGNTSGDGESELTMWSLRSGSRLLSLIRPGGVNAISFSPTGDRLVALFSPYTRRVGLDKPIQIWDATPLPEEIAK